jgi:chitodextrinase
MKTNKFITKCGVIMLILVLTLLQSITAECEYSKVTGIFTAPDTQAPTTPRDLKATNVTFTSAVLTWKPAADNVGIKGYEVYCNGKKVASTSATVYEYKQLSPGAAYLFYVKAYDKVGNYSTQSSILSVNTQIDKTAPSTPSGLKVSSVSETEVNLIWTPSSDNVKVRGYDILRSGVKIGTASKTSYSNKNLTPSKSYTYTVRASDISGNLSSSSIPITATTAKDSQAPTAPTQLKIATIKGASVSLEWISSSDNSKVAGYQIYCNGIVIATAAGTSRIVKSPFNLGADTYFIKAYDIAGNLSAGSNTITAVTASE